MARLSKKFQYHYRPVIKVYCSSCKDWRDEKKVEFIDICEGPRGEDILTFNCDRCKTKNESVRIS